MTKKLLVYTLSVIMLFGCQKKIETLDISKETDVLKVEHGYLFFKSYDDFFSTLVNSASLNPDQRKSWETSINFKSFYSKGQEFLQKINDADEKKDESLSAKLILDYKDFIRVEKDLSFQLKAPGILESYLINTEGLIKVDKDYLLYNELGFTTYHNLTYSEIKEIIKSGTSVSNRTIIGTPPSANFYTVVMTGFQTTNSNESNKARFNHRLKLYNLNSTTSGNRGFVAIEYFADHKNWLGSWRTVSSAVDWIANSIEVKFSDNTTTAISYSTINPPVYGTPTNYGAWTSGWNEKIVLISDYLKNNSISSTHPLYPYLNTNASLGVKTLNDDAISSVGGYWSEAKSVTGMSVPLRLLFYCSSFGTGAFSATRSYNIYEGD